MDRRHHEGFYSYHRPYPTKWTVVTMKDYPVHSATLVSCRAQWNSVTNLPRRNLSTPRRILAVCLAMIEVKTSIAHNLSIVTRCSDPHHKSNVHCALCKHRRFLQANDKSAACGLRKKACMLLSAGLFQRRSFFPSMGLLQRWQ